MSDIDFTNTYEVLRILNNYKNTYAITFDELPITIMKQCGNFYSRLIEKIFNLTLSSGEIPLNWKKGLVFPKFKSGSKMEISSFRFITNTSYIGKIGEKIILSRMINYIRNNSILPPYQYGYRSKMSATDNLIKFTRDLFHSLELKHDVDVIYVDIKAAFDSIDHHTLIMKLINLKFPYYIIMWICQFIANRVIITEIDEVRSSEFRISKGIPQGSVISGILFNLYMVGVGNNLRVGILQFADDMKLYTEITDLMSCKILQEDLNKLISWCSENKLEINAQKTVTMHFGKKNQKFNYKINGDNLKQVNCYKDLGLLINDSLSFSEYSANIAQRMTKVFAISKNIFKRLNVQTFRFIYKNYIIPIIDYGSSASIIGRKIDIVKIERTFRRMTKQIGGYTLIDHVVRYDLVNVLSPRQRIVYNDIMFMYKSIILNKNSDLLFSLNNRENKRTHRFAVKKISVKSKILINSVYHRSIDLWNNIPKNYFDVKLKEFRIMIQTYIKEIIIYTDVF